ncbi:MAG: HEAT repeat domain-containing protein, partial [Thermoplasmata archaeon]
DILCLTCGTRVESRGKTKVEVSMSHSKASAERGWDFGLKDDDLVAFVKCSRVGDEPTEWQAADLVQYLTVGEMREAYSAGRVKISEAKGAEEGFEVRVTWPTSLATADGMVVEVSDANIQYRRHRDGRILTLGRLKSGVQLEPQIAVGERVTEGRFVASAVPVYLNVACRGGADEEYYTALLASSSLSDRYTAAKALSRFDTDGSRSLLASKLSDDADHIYVRLEAAAGIMRRNEGRGQAFIESCLESEYLEHRLEAVILLGEVGSVDSYRLLLKTLNDSKQDPEIRAGGAWSIGELRERTSLDALVECFGAVDEPIRVEAARALAKLASSFPDEVAARLGRTDPVRRPGVAWALSRLEHVEIERLIPELVDEDARHWVAFVVGTHDPAKYVNAIEKLRQTDGEVYFAVTVLWKILQSWVFGLDEHL